MSEPNKPDITAAMAADTQRDAPEVAEPEVPDPRLAELAPLMVEASQKVYDGQYGLAVAKAALEWFDRRMTPVPDTARVADLRKIIDVACDELVMAGAVGGAAAIAAAADRVCSALAQPAPRPDVVMVPREPTMEMVWDSCKPLRQWADGTLSDEEAVISIYAAMLGAAHPTREPSDG